MDCFISLLEALLTPTIGAIVAYIAWQQWKLGKVRLKLDLYDRRYRVYEETRKYLTLVLRDADVSIKDLLMFHAETSEAAFLFGSEIPAYLDDLYKHGNALRHWNGQYRDITQPASPDYDHEKVVEEMHNELTWLSEQIVPLKDKFSEYLRLEEVT